MRQTEEIYALNYSLWRFLYDASRESLHTVRRSFDFSIETFDTIAQFSDQRLQRLCSETLVFFSIKENEALVLAEISTFPGDSVDLERGYTTAFSQLWWLSLARMAASDPLMSTQIFGISAQFAEQIAAIPMQHIMQFCAVKKVAFNLRFDPAYVKPILSSQNVSPHLFLKIHQQALSRLT